MSPRLENEPPPASNNLAAVPVAIVSSTSSLNPILPNQSDCDNSSNIITNLSPRRWFILFAMSCFGFALSVTGDTAPILNLILQLLDLPLDKYVYLTQIFVYLMAIVAVPSAVMVDKYGIKVAFYIAVGLFIVNCSFRALLYYPGSPHWGKFKLYYYIASGIVGTQVSGIVLSMPLKVSETWFSESERSVAWTIMVSQMELGVCLASFIYPRLMPDLEHIKFLAYINIVSIFVMTIVCLFCVTRGAPEHPPSKRMAESSKDKTPFFQSVKKMFKDKNIMLHLIHSVISQSLSLSIFMILQSILISAGHSAIFAGDFMSINALVSIIMLVCMSRFVHRVKNTVLTCKLSSLASGLLYIAYLITLICSAPGWVIVCVSMVLTISKSWTSPNFTNMTAHLASGVVSQATIVGVSVTLTVGVVTLLQVTLVNLSKIDDNTYDYSKSFVLFSLICLINELIYLTCFQGRTPVRTSDDTNLNSEESAR